MNSFKYILKRHYLTGFCVGLILWAAAVLGSVLGDSETIESYGFLKALVFSLVFGVVLWGGGSHLYMEVIRPWWTKRMIRRPKFSYLEELGFVFDPENDVYEGVVKSYYVTISAENDMHAGDALEISVFIDPSDNQIELLTDMEGKYILDSSDRYVWLSKNVHFVFNSPKKEKMEHEINNLVDDLRFKHIKPDQPLVDEMLLFLEQKHGKTSESN